MRERACVRERGNLSYLNRYNKLASVCVWERKQELKRTRKRERERERNRYEVKQTEIKCIVDCEEKRKEKKKG